MRSSSDCFGDVSQARTILNIWRTKGVPAARKHALFLHHISPFFPGTLPFELLARLTNLPSPRILIDGIWLSRPLGGITRIWQQIFHLWELDGLVQPSAPIFLLNRGCHLPIPSNISSFLAPPCDPTSYSSLAALSQQNAHYVSRLGIDTFISSWITASGFAQPSCTEVALVHDCIPEYYDSQNQELRVARNRWLAGATGHLCVSQDTSLFVKHFFPSSSCVSWCNPSPYIDFFISSNDQSYAQSCPFLPDLINGPYLLFPSISAVGSYKNPELIAQALIHPSCSSVALVLTGANSHHYSLELSSQYPQLKSRIYCFDCTTSQLSFLYKHALAVVVPSRIEGFGLPVIEALASSAIVLISHSFGLRNAGGKICPRLNPDDPNDLVSWLQLLMHPPSSSWFLTRYHKRRLAYIRNCQPDLLGLALLAISRQLFTQPLSHDPLR